MWTVRFALQTDGWTFVELDISGLRIACENRPSWSNWLFVDPQSLARGRCSITSTFADISGLSITSWEARLRAEVGPSVESLTFVGRNYQSPWTLWASARSKWKTGPVDHHRSERNDTWTSTEKKKERNLMSQTCPSIVLRIKNLD